MSKGKEKGFPGRLRMSKGKEKGFPGRLRMSGGGMRRFFPFLQEGSE